MGESVIASDCLALNTSRDVHVGTWWFETVSVGIITGIRQPDLRDFA